MPDSLNKILSWLSFRVTRGICFLFALAFLFAAVSASAQTIPERPKITGIASVHFYSTNVPQARAFYSRILDPAVTCTMCERVPPPILNFASGQFVMISPAGPNPPTNLLAELFFATDDLKAMRHYLKSNNLLGTEQNPDSDSPIVLKDPEGHQIWFVKAPKSATPVDNTLPLRIIHAGFIVNDRATEEHFYKDILGFRPYWHGGMKDDETTWVSLQVPDGSDWIEFMLYDDSKADKHFRGVMNHFAVGVVDIQAEKELLLKRDWKLTEEPKLGRDGKWQLNVYDPDETRVEFMEFTPKEKPCCSEFTAPHPKP